MVKKISIAVVALFLCIQLEAQRNEFGLFLGSSYYMGDLNPKKHFGLAQPAGGVLNRINFTPSKIRKRMQFKLG